MIQQIGGGFGLQASSARVLMKQSLLLLAFVSTNPRFRNGPVDATMLLRSHNTVSLMEM